MTDEGLYSVFRRPAERSRKLDFIEETDPREDFVGYYLVVEQATGRKGGGFAFDE